MQRPLNPGELTKPVRVWCSSTSLRIAWYQAEPLSESVTIFYKKSGSLFGTEIVLPTASLLGPDLSMTAPLVVNGGKAEYFELDIRKLKPNTQYVVKVRAQVSGTQLAANAQALASNAPTSEPLSGMTGPAPPSAAYTTRSDRLSTLGAQEESKRNLDMANFIGSLIKLGEYDGTVVNFDLTTGLYEVRILQVEEVGNAVQLVRLTSEYTDLGLPARTYSLSSIRFGRWGGEISDSQVVGENELKWIVGRSVALAERSEAASNYSVKEHLLQAQNDNLKNQMEAQRQAAMLSLSYTRRIYRGLFVLLLVVFALLLALATWWARRQVAAARALQGAAETRSGLLYAELRRLQLYRMSLELDTGAWIHAAAASTASAALRARRGTAGPYTNSTQCPAPGTPGFSGLGNDTLDSDTLASLQCSVGEPESGGADGAQGAAGGFWPVGSSHPLLHEQGPLRDALRRRRKRQQEKRENESDSVSPPAADGSTAGGSSGVADGEADKGANVDQGDSSKVGEGGAFMGSETLQAEMLRGSENDTSREPPAPWEYVNYAANLYAVYLNEWLKLQMAKSIRSNIETLLAEGPQGEDQSVGADSSKPTESDGSDGTADSGGTIDGAQDTQKDRTAVHKRANWGSLQKAMGSLRSLWGGKEKDSEDADGGLGPRARRIRRVRERMSRQRSGERSGGAPIHRLSRRGPRYRQDRAADDGQPSQPDTVPDRRAVQRRRQPAYEYEYDDEDDAYYD